jgi:hypothetical protein
MMQRYHAAGLVVAIAEPHDPTIGAASGLTLNVTTYDQTGAKGTQTLKIDPVAGEQSDKTLARGVGAVADALESGWRQSIASGGSIGLTAPAQTDGAAAQLGGGPAVSYSVGVPVAGLEGWVKLRNQLTATPGMQRVALDALTRDGAALTLDFSGDVVALQAALSGSGYVLAQTSPGNAAGPGTFELRPAGFEPPRQMSMPPPPPPPVRQ